MKFAKHFHEFIWTLLTFLENSLIKPYFNANSDLDNLNESYAQCIIIDNIDDIKAYKIMIQ